MVLFNKKLFGFILGPILFFLILFMTPVEGISENGIKVIACGVLMLTWWITGAVPEAITSLIPIAFFPLLGVASMKQAAAPYASPIIYLFMGGFIIAAAIEKWNLHKRLALNIIKIIGTNTQGIIGGFIIATGFISLWMSNTATVVMMLPIASSVVEILINKNSETKDHKNFAAALILSIAYAANFGGIGTLIGTPPNGILVAFMKETYNFEVNFLQWLIVGFPFAVLMLFSCWFVFIKIVFPIKTKEFDNSVITEELKSLGKISREEKMLVIVFIITISLWIASPFLKNFFPKTLICESTIAILAAMSLFMIPTNIAEGKFLLNWDSVKNIPWGILLLFGGGLSLAAALEYSGILTFIQQQMSGLKELSPIEMIVAVAIATTIATTFIGNAAVTSMCLPIATSVAIGLNIHPLPAALTTAIIASCSLMLPISTPPNAIVYATKRISILDLIKAGFILNVIAIIIAALTFYPLIELAFGIDLSIFPEWVSKVKVK